MSRFAHGSSAKTIAGLFTSARAIATRCCSPPERLELEVVGPIQKADLVQYLAGRPEVLVAPGAADERGKEDILDRRQLADQGVVLETTRAGRA